MSWASRRRSLYLLILFLLIAFPTAVGVVFWLYEAPTCFDGVLNQGEFSIDKGGPCQLLDERQLIPYAIMWARPFTVREGVASAAAYIENPNQNAGVQRARYRFRLYDEKNVLVAEKEGETAIMPGVVTPVFEGTLPTGSRTAARAFFEFTEPLVWERLNDTSVLMRVRNKLLSGEDTEPRVAVDITNTSSKDAMDVVFVATLFDSAGNAFASSETVVPLLIGKETVAVVFTWPRPLNRRAARIDVLPVLPPELPR